MAALQRASTRPHGPSTWVIETCQILPILGQSAGETGNHNGTQIGEVLSDMLIFIASSCVDRRRAAYLMRMSFET